MKYFETIFLEEAERFISKLDNKSAVKIIYNIDLAEQTNDPKLFKKLSDEIWEFRTKYQGRQYRLLAFWDKRDNKKHTGYCDTRVCKERSESTSKRSR